MQIVTPRVEYREMTNRLWQLIRTNPGISEDDLMGKLTEREDIIEMTPNLLFLARAGYTYFKFSLTPKGRREVNLYAKEPHEQEPCLKCGEPMPEFQRGYGAENCIQCHVGRRDADDRP